MKNHLQSLIRRHRAVDLRIEAESRRPLSPPELRSLKRLRLMLKDRIEALRRRESRQGA